MRIRFIAKELPLLGGGRGKVWRVYDIQNGSFPYRTAELGQVAQDHVGADAEKACQAECDRLTAEHGGVDEKKQARSKRPPISGGYDPNEGD